MKLYFLRHGTAADIAPSDAERSLTSEGKVEAHIAGLALRALGVRAGAILTSPLVRAAQTAALAAKAMEFDGEIVPVDELQNSGLTGELLRAIKRHAADAGEVLLVGHMPSLAQHLAVLIGVNEPAGLSLGKGTIACVELTASRAGGGTLRWFMRQKQLAKLAR